MQNGYYQATGAMVTQFNRLDTISNNLANVNTYGYKRKDVVVGDFERIFKDSEDELPLKNHTKDAAKFLNRTLDRVPVISESYTDFSAAGMKYTSNPLDFAIKQDDAFFAVQTESGVMLSKNGAFSLDAEGYIINKEGYRILGENNQPIALDTDAQISVDKSGYIYEDGEVANKFNILSVQDVRDLNKIGDNLYSPNARADVRAGDDEADLLVQGYVQMSNVNPVTEMVALIETNRLVEMYQRVMNSQMNDINQDAITKLGAVKQ
ncbi:flagellar hook-basal body protein [Campylobacter sp. 19-13652]|uniref:flagellar hook-basal body protein n=1 Tax=Campylobacter sp. 19-13652 TaxID=2840180 RepID=UPI001C740F19|nr:flagellar hook-basal body protein [Campylobacter sp. 19-13652]BCX79115.1 flagellar basal body protein [Campylobacter sp. 19-13652]